MTGRPQYVFWSNALQGYHVKGGHNYSPDVADATRLSEGAALDAIVQFAREDDPTKGHVLILAPECRA